MNPLVRNGGLHRLIADERDIVGILAYVMKKAMFYSTQLQALNVDTHCHITKSVCLASDVTKLDSFLCNLSH